MGVGLGCGGGELQQVIGIKGRVGWRCGVEWRQGGGGGGGEGGRRSVMQRTCS